MTEYTRFLAPTRIAVAVARVFGHGLPTLIIVEQETLGKIAEVAAYLQDFGDRFSED